MTSKLWPNQKKWRQKIAEMIDEELRAAGFEQTDYYTYSRRVRHEICGVVSMASGARNHFQDANVTIVTPILGIRHDRIEEVFAEVLPDRNPIGERSWTLWEYFNSLAGISPMVETEIQKDEGIDGSRRIIKDIVKKLAEHGADLWKDFNSIEDFVLRMQANELEHELQCMYEFKYPISLLCANRKQEALDIIESQYRDMESLRLNQSFYMQFRDKFISFAAKTD